MTMADSSKFVPFWLDEKDWICTLVFLSPEDEADGEKGEGERAGIELNGHFGRMKFELRIRWLRSDG